ncbi:MAG: hypothetical protein IJS47_01740 [Clostridia bacterium]|nr:hypothetical protein [Clostridia bacterium]
MGRRLALYSDILEKMSLGIEEYLEFYSAKADSYERLGKLKTQYENAKNGYEASLMINYDKDSKNFHEKNMSKIKTELTVLQQNLYPVVYSNNKVKSTFQRLFFIPYNRKNKVTSGRMEELNMRLKKSQEAYEFYKNKYDLGCNYLRVLGFDSGKNDINYIKKTFDNTVLEFNEFILKNGKYFENMKSNEDFYKMSKTQIEEQLQDTKYKIKMLGQIGEDFNAKKDTLENVAEAKQLLSDVNQRIMSIIQ